MSRFTHHHKEICNSEKFRVCGYYEDNELVSFFLQCELCKKLIGKLGEHSSEHENTGGPIDDLDEDQ